MCVLFLKQVKWRSNVPICSIYGIFTYIYHKSKPNVGKYSIHGAFGVYNSRSWTSASTKVIAWRYVLRKVIVHIVDAHGTYIYIYTLEAGGSPGTPAPRVFIYIYI